MKCFLVVNWHLIKVFLCVQNGNAQPEKKLQKLQSTKKRGCKAVLSYERVIRFPSSAIAVGADATATHLKKMKESAVTTLLAERSQIQVSERFYLSVPTRDSHDGHLSSALGQAAASLSQRVHPRIIERIHDYVEAGVRDAKEIKKLLALEVSNFSHQADSDWALHVPRRILCCKFSTNMKLWFFYERIREEKKYERWHGTSQLAYNTIMIYIHACHQ